MRYKTAHPIRRPAIDLLREAVRSVRDISINIHLWADGIACPRDIPDVEIPEPGLVSIVSLINMCLHRIVGR